MRMRADVLLLTGRSSRSSRSESHKPKRRTFVSRCLLTRMRFVSAPVFGSCDHLGFDKTYGLVQERCVLSMRSYKQYCSCVVSYFK